MLSSISAGVGGGQMSLTLLPDSEKLQTANWNEWKQTIALILRMKGLMGYADGSIRPPSKLISLPIPIIATPATPTPAAQVASSSLNPFITGLQQQQPPTQSTGAAFRLSPSHTPSHPKPLPLIPTQPEDEWAHLDAAAATHITLNIKSQVILSKFRDGMSAQEIWSSLCTRFERSNGFLALQAQNKLTSCKYTDGQDLQSHLDTMSKLWEEALAVGVKIPDKEFCHILRSSFLPSWVFLITTLIHSNNPILLKTSLLAFADI